jgi:hypothetical protein
VALPPSAAPVGGAPSRAPAVGDVDNIWDGADPPDATVATGADMVSPGAPPIPDFIPLPIPMPLPLPCTGLTDAGP